MTSLFIINIQTFRFGQSGDGQVVAFFRHVFGFILTSNISICLGFCSIITAEPHTKYYDLQIKFDSLRQFKPP